MSKTFFLVRNDVLWREKLYLVTKEKNPKTQGKDARIICQISTNKRGKDILSKFSEKFIHVDENFFLCDEKKACKLLSSFGVNSPIKKRVHSIVPEEGIDEFLASFEVEDYQPLQGGWIKCSDIYETYRTWCSAKGMEACTANKFGRASKQVFEKKVALVDGKAFKLYRKK